MTRSNEPETDRMLASLLAPPRRGGDRIFVAEVERTVAARLAYAQARARFWRSFALEASAVLALLAAFWVLSATPVLAPLAGPAHWGIAPPLLLVLLLWFGTQRWRET